MPTISGKSLVDAVIIDVRTFFPNRPTFGIKVEYSGRGPSCLGVGVDTRIRLPREFQALQISTADDLHFWLIVLGHEIAHYLNRHNDFNVGVQESALETRSIEDWADFFGTKLMMTIITFGPLISPFYREYPENARYETRVDSMANAFARLANSFYITDSPRYSPRASRVGNGVAAICSFLDKYNGGMQVFRSFAVMKRIYFSPSLDQIMQSEPLSFPEDVSTIVDIHQTIQGVAPAITEGLRADLVKFIGTTYATTPEERSNYVSAMRAQALRQGVPPELLPEKKT